MGGKTDILHYYQVMQDPDTWTITAETERFSIRGLSTTPDAITAELYDRENPMQPMLGAVALKRNELGNWTGMDELVTIIQSVS